jgi:small GTP-binding protein
VETGPRISIPIIHIDNIPTEPVEKFTRPRLSSRSDSRTNAQANLPSRLQSSIDANDVETLQADVIESIRPRRSSMQSSLSIADRSESRQSLDSVLFTSKADLVPRQETVFPPPPSHQLRRSQTQQPSSSGMKPSRSAGAGPSRQAYRVPQAPRHISYASPPSTNLHRTSTAPSLHFSSKPIILPDLNTPEGIETKLAFFGAVNAGKTSLIQRWKHGSFTPAAQPPTLGGELVSRVVYQDGIRLALQLWDTSGQERFKSLTRMYYRGTHVCVLVYDTTERQSFVDVKWWIEDVRKEVPEAMIFVVGSKMDLEIKRVFR